MGRGVPFSAIPRTFQEEEWNQIHDRRQQICKTNEICHYNEVRDGERLSQSAMWVSAGLGQSCWNTILQVLQSLHLLLASLSPVMIKSMSPLLIHIHNLFPSFKQQQQFILRKTLSCPSWPLTHDPPALASWMLRLEYVPPYLNFTFLTFKEINDSLEQKNVDKAWIETREGRASSRQSRLEVVEHPLVSQVWKREKRHGAGWGVGGGVGGCPLDSIACRVR